jgi:hypothetical protein
LYYKIIIIRSLLLEKMKAVTKKGGFHAKR